MVDRNASKHGVVLRGSPVFRGSPARFVLGVNYWPRNHGVQMWKEWDQGEIRQEFAEISALGLDVVRVFLLWEDFQPSPEVVDEQNLGKFDELLAIARDCGLKIVPTFFTGHMSGENWDVPWRHGRDPYSDPFMLRAQAKLVDVFARRYAEENTILFWDLANEPDIFVRPRCRHAAWLWADFMAKTIRIWDRNHPVTLGIHMQSLSDDNGIRPEDMAESNDFLCMHAYPLYTELCPEPLNAFRSTYLVPFCSKLTEGMGRKSVFFEEFGGTTQMVSEDILAGYYSATLYSLLANGALGALAWCFGDFTVGERLPYNSTPYEAGFGITKVSGEPKKPALVMKQLALLARRVGPVSPFPGAPRAAILIPRRYYDNYDPDVTPERNMRALFNSFLLAKQAGLNPDLVRLDSDLEGYDIYFLPSFSRRGSLYVSDWKRITELVHAGKTLYCSYGGIAIEGFDEVFGIEVVSTSYKWPGMRIGIFDDLGGLECETAGFEDKLVLPIPGVALGRTKVLDVRPAGCRVVASYLADSHPLVLHSRGTASRKARYACEEDPCENCEKVQVEIPLHGSPAIVVNDFGRGKTILVTFPLELAISYEVGVYETSPWYRVYRYAAGLTGRRSAFTCTNPFIEIMPLIKGTGASKEPGGGPALPDYSIPDYLIVVNHDSSPKVADLQVGAPWVDRLRRLTVSDAGDVEPFDISGFSPNAPIDGIVLDGTLPRVFSTRLDANEGCILQVVVRLREE
ncbi:MAG TPA: cellulase family glycosylhydrolase [Firmicutes bacterium]|nr:cellulase family glycosylhydrolase [Bacillota bacterium]